MYHDDVVLKGTVCIWYDSQGGPKHVEPVSIGSFSMSVCLKVFHFQAPGLMASTISETSTALFQKRFHLSRETVEEDVVIY